MLIDRAPGGIGTFAVQIAKSYGSEVTGVTSTRNIDLVGSLGADHVLDYTTTDFFANGRRYDLILDTIGNLSVRDLRGALPSARSKARRGRVHQCGEADRCAAARTSPWCRRMFATTDLEFLSNLIEAGKVHPHIDRRYPFAEIPPQQSPSSNKATPEGRSSWARREIRPWSAPLPTPAAHCELWWSRHKPSRMAEPQTDRGSQIKLRVRAWERFRTLTMRRIGADVSRCMVNVRTCSMKMRWRWCGKPKAQAGRYSFVSQDRPACFGDRADEDGHGSDLLGA